MIKGNASWPFAPSSVCTHYRGKLKGKGVEEEIQEAGQSELKNCVWFPADGKTIFTLLLATEFDTYYSIKSSEYFSKVLKYSNKDDR